VAKKLGDPEILKVHFDSFRYWVGTYHRTKDLLHVQAILGHKNIEITRKYVKMSEAIYNINADSRIHTRVATTQAEIEALLNSDFDYVMQKDGLAYFRKRD
jgi:integrase